MRKLYLECYSGISGDMTVSALLDLGADKEVLLDTLKTLPLSGYKVEIKDVFKAGIKACDFNVILEAELDNHDHDMEYLYGHQHEHHHEHEHSHEHGQEQRHEHHHHAHSHRGLAEVLEILRGGKLTNRALEIAESVFNVLAEAEAKAHGTDIENVHFHEVGAVDSIVDIAAFAICLDNLGLEEVIVPVLYEGGGTIRCQHGILPVPVPAVSNIVSKHGIKLHMTGINAELVTPTGAAIVAAVRTSDSLPADYSISKIGYGAGKREYETPSMVRAMIIESENDSEKYICRLESNIDDCTGEMLGHVMDKLMENGARDVHFIPVFMKKCRPAYELVVICMPKDISKMEEIIFSETTTIGIRRIMMERTVLDRTIDKIETPFGEMLVKVCILPDGTVRRYPEYESVNQICKKNNISIQEIYRFIR